MFHRPWVLLLLLLLPFFAWRLWASRRTEAIAFSSTSFAKLIRPTLRQRLSWIPSALLLTTVALLIISLAGPREGRQQSVSDTEGIAIELVVDRSGSMQALDFQKGESPVDRLTAIKDVAGRFVLGDQDQLSGRANDLVGLISFAGMADGVTPPTLDHAFLVAQLNETEIVNRRSEDGTAIGDAIGLAVEKLAALEKNQSTPIKSRIIILLTDGESNAGSLDPLEAADLAKMMNIKVYTIGVGTKGRAPYPLTDMLGRRVIRWTDVTIDEDALKKISKATGGKYFRATNTQSLEKIYQEIDQLEKSKVEERQYVDYRELAVQPIRFRSFSIPPFAFWAFLTLSLQLVLKHTVFREFG